MFLSGWAIYNASPSLPFTFPRNLTLGGWLAAGIAWHISVMWVLFADGLAYIAYGIASKHFWRDLRPTEPRAVLRDLSDAAAAHPRMGSPGAVGNSGKARLQERQEPRVDRGDKHLSGGFWENQDYDWFSGV
jgi:hypothetical protein